MRGGDTRRWIKVKTGLYLKESQAVLRRDIVGNDEMKIQDLLNQSKPC